MRKLLLLFAILSFGLSYSQNKIEGNWVGQLDGGYLKLELKENNDVFMVYDEDTLYSAKIDTFDLRLNYYYTPKSDTSLFKLTFSVNGVLDDVESFEAKVVWDGPNRMKWFLIYEGEDDEDMYEVQMERLKE